MLQRKKRRYVVIVFKDGCKFNGWDSAAAAFGVSRPNLIWRRKRGYAPFGDIEPRNYPPDSKQEHLVRWRERDKAREDAKERKDRDRRLIALQHELFVCLVEKLTRPENSHLAAKAVEILNHANL